MRVPLHLVEARRDRLADLLRQHRFAPLATLCKRLGVSEATARRDLAALARKKRITRTWGGALVDFNQRFPSFRERQSHAQAAKRQMATRGLHELKPGTTCFFDAGTTIYAIAEALAASTVKSLTVVTNSLPVADKLAEKQDVEVHLVGGQYLARQSVLFGESARRSLRLWKLDLAFLGAEGMNSAGLWNSQRDVVAFQRDVVKRCPRVVFCMDASKLNREAPEFLLPWSQVPQLLTNATPNKLKAADIKLTRRQYLEA